MIESETFNALKYKRYASTITEVGGIWIPAGATYWVNDAGQLHREDGPAIERANGSAEWYLNGELHREDGPAIERANGSAEWYLNGKFIRSKWRHHIQCSKV